MSNGGQFNPYILQMLMQSQMQSPSQRKLLAEGSPPFTGSTPPAPELPPGMGIGRPMINTVPGFPTMGPRPQFPFNPYGIPGSVPQGPQTPPGPPPAPSPSQPSFPSAPTNPAPSAPSNPRQPAPNTPAPTGQYGTVNPVTPPDQTGPQTYSNPALDLPSYYDAPSASAAGQTEMQNYNSPEYANYYYSLPPSTRAFMHAPGSQQTGDFLANRAAGAWTAFNGTNPYGG